MMSERSGSDHRVVLDYFQPVDAEDTWCVVDRVLLRAVVTVGIIFVLLALVSAFLV
jgi:hypothetical protein